jgi:hypothetical protein
MSLYETGGSLPYAQEPSPSLAHIPDPINPVPIFKGSSTVIDGPGGISICRLTSSCTTIFYNYDVLRVLHDLSVFFFRSEYPNNFDDVPKFEPHQCSQRPHASLSLRPKQ